MVYLVMVSYYDRGVDLPKNLLKIGYTQDNNLKTRKYAYLSYNPLCEFLLTIPGATEEHEKKLHYKFREHLYPDFGNEWFIYSDEIINYLQTVTLQELDKLPINPIFSRVRNNNLLKDRKIMILLDYILRGEGREDITREDMKEMLKVVKLSSTTIENIFLDLKSSNHYPSISSKTWSEVESILYPSISPEESYVYEFFQEYDLLEKWVDKIKFICEYILSNPETEEKIISNLVDSDKIKQQLITLGADKIKGWGYNITKIKKAMGITIFDQKSFLKEIYNCFREGQRYTKKFIKSELGAIYKAADYQKTSKASDLENWFEIRRCKITIGDKREEAFEIIKKK